MKFLVIVLFYFAISGKVKSIEADTASNTCKFRALFNFGDSNSDTGGAYIYFHSVNWPNGMTVGKVFKRFSDGRLIIDFIAESLGFPYLNASADTNGTSFNFGANFAVGGSGINPEISGDNKTIFYYHLDEQMSRFLDFKSRALASKEPESTNIYPKPEAFQEALYTIDIGQNEVTNFFGLKPIPTILDWYTKSVRRLLNDGAKYLWVHNTCPAGCLPNMLERLEAGVAGPFTRDNYGCGVEFNKMSQDFNSELKLRIDLLRTQYPHAVITLVDMYSAKYQLIVNPQGFDASLKLKYCCGRGYWRPLCADTLVVENKTVFGGACNNPAKYLSWDSVHWTEAANKVLAKHISGSLSKACSR